MSSFFADELASIQRMELERCRDAAERSRLPLVIGYANALRLWGLPVPNALPDDRIHVIADDVTRRPRLKGVAAHIWKGSCEFREPPSERFLISSPIAAWAQMATYTTWQDLAVIGSSLLSRNQQHLGITLQELISYVHRNPKFKLRIRCMESIPFVIENTDSPPEAKLYIILVRAGITDIVANYPVRTASGIMRFIDLAIPDLKIGFEYQGAYHGSTRQMRNDANKMNQLLDQGWVILQVTADDIRTETGKEAMLETAMHVIAQRRALIPSVRGF
jgi:very-short-patch-repair endonuclease